MSKNTEPNVSDFVSLEKSVALFPEILRPTYASVRRYATTGLSGQRLETIKFGNKRFTTQAWVEEFIAAAIQKD